MPPKQICKFYQKGYCRNGDRCNFLHVDPDQEAVPNRVTSAAQFVNLDPSHIAKEIRDDLDEYLLIQLNPALTAYGTGEFAINNLIAGRDVSPEELRIQYMEAVMNNKLDEFNRAVELKKKDMEYCINEVRKKDSLAARYQQVGISHRDTMKPFIDKTVEQSMTELQNTVGNNNSSNVFGGGAGAFGSSGFGLNSNPFGSNSNPFGSAASKPSGFGSSGFSSSGFGNSNSGPNTGSAFGLTGVATANNNSAPAASTNSGFGNSGFGTAGFGSSATGGAFGSQKPSSGFGSAGFGQSGGSAFGSGAGAFGLQSGNKSQSPFSSSSGPPATNSTSGGFGSTTATSAFGNSDFGASKPNDASGFGSSGFGSSGFGSSGFGQSGFGSTQPSAFGQQNNQASNSTFNTTGTFGASSSPFGTVQTNTPSAFGNATTDTKQNTTAANPFGSQSAFGQPVQAATSGFGQNTPAVGQSLSGIGGFSSSASTNSAFGTSNNSTQLPNSAASAAGGGFGGGFGGAQPASNTAALDKFDPEVAKAFLAARFELGKIPEVVPPPQVC